MYTNDQNITHSLGFLRDVIDRRLQDFFQKENAPPFNYPELITEPGDTPLNHFVLQHQLNMEEFVILLLALAPHIQTNYVDSIIQSYLPAGGDFPEIGGVKGSNHRSMMPTGETALFILAGNDILKRIQASAYFSRTMFLLKKIFSSWKQ